MLLRGYSRGAFRAGRAVVLAGVFWGLAVTGVYSLVFIKEVFALTPRDRFLSRTTDFHDTYSWMADNLPPRARVLVAATNDLYYCPRRAMRLGMDDAYTHTDSGELFGLGEYGRRYTALRRMQALGITHIFAHSDLVARPSRSVAGAVLHEMLARGNLRMIHEAEDTRGTRTPLGKARSERVAVCELVYPTGARP